MEKVLEQIRAFAEQAHGTQVRKYTPEPYIVHPVRVMETCCNYIPQLPILAAALLHDVLEDTSVAPKEMRDFLHTLMDDGQVELTMKCVEELTDVYVKEAYPQWNRRQRKERELERIAHTSAEAQTIKYADILDNCKEFAVQNPEFAPRYLRECLAILQRADKGDKNLRHMALDTVKYNLGQLKCDGHG